MTKWSLVYGAETVAKDLTDAQKHQLQNDITQALRDGHHWFALETIRPPLQPIELLISAGIPISFVGERDMSNVRPVTSL